MFARREGGRYVEIAELGRGAVLRCAALPTVAVAIDDLFAP